MSDLKADIIRYIRFPVLGSMISVNDHISAISQFNLNVMADDLEIIDLTGDRGLVVRILNYSPTKVKCIKNKNKEIYKVYHPDMMYCVKQIINGQIIRNIKIHTKKNPHKTGFAFWDYEEHLLYTIQPDDKIIEIWFSP